jgi:hypothetical protein
MFSVDEVGNNMNSPKDPDIRGLREKDLWRALWNHQQGWISWCESNGMSYTGQNGESVRSADYAELRRLGDKLFIKTNSPTSTVTDYKEPCRYCSGTGKITLLTSVVDCECRTKPDTNINSPNSRPRFLPAPKLVEDSEFLGHYDMLEHQYDAYYDKNENRVIAVWKELGTIGYDGKPIEYIKDNFVVRWYIEVYEKFLKPRGI